jgi:hypothetical protein
MAIAKRIAMWVGIVMIMIVKLPFTVLSFIATGIEYFLIRLAGIVFGKYGGRNEHEMYNYAMDANIECLDAWDELLNDMKL